MSPPTFTSLSARAALLTAPDVDTDQIIPARFLKTTARAGLGAHLFADRADRPAPAPILVAGPNFGCGSSREHAVWALVDAGYRAVVSPRFADIFRQNALKNGLLPVELDAAAHARLVELCAATPGAPEPIVAIDLVTQILTLPDGGAATFPIDPFAKRCLLDGVDELGYLLSRLPAIEAHERRRAL